MKCVQNAKAGKVMNYTKSCFTIVVTDIGIPVHISVVTSGVVIAISVAVVVSGVHATIVIAVAVTSIS